MEQKIFSIYDSKAKIWSRPMYVQETGQMIREFQDIANDKNHPIGKHPEDYALYQIGIWEDKHGIMTQLKESISLGLATSFKKDDFPGFTGEGPTVGRKKTKDNN